MTFVYTRWQDCPWLIIILHMRIDIAFSSIWSFYISFANAPDSYNNPTFTVGSLTNV